MGKDYRTIKIEATKLRKRGLSYNEIKKKVGIGKGTLSFWLKNIALKPEHKARLYTKQVAILSRGSQSQKERRAREVDQIIKLAGEEIKNPIDVEAYRLMGAALYWAEGSKGKMFTFTNSDPHMILFMVRWIGLIFNIPAQNLKARLNIYPQQSEAKIKKFWSDLTDIPVKNFGKTYVKPLSTGFKKNNLYYGTMRIEVPKSVNMQYRIFGWVKTALKNLDPEVKLAQRKWQGLSKVNRPIPINLQRDKTKI